jgi:hypothetical protein
MRGKHKERFVTYSRDFITNAYLQQGVSPDEVEMLAEYMYRKIRLLCFSEAHFWRKVLKFEVNGFMSNFEEEDEDSYDS